jgi:oligopeptide/dipeptide ABC transporter ATP-binding protein
VSGIEADVLEVSDLRRHFGQRGWARRGAAIKAVDGVSFAIARGEAFGLVGESGSGKSTVARCVLGLERIDGGRVMLAGEDVTRTGERSARSRLQAVFQNPASSLNPRWTVSECVAEPLRVRGIAAGEADARVREVLHQVGLTAAMARRHPHELSGGQQQRVAMARAISTRPELVVADEPLSALDVSIQAQILNLMLELKKSIGLSYLFISHDLTVTRHLCEVVAVFYRGRIVESGPSAEVFAHPRHPYTAALVAASVQRAAPGGRNLSMNGPGNGAEEGAATGCSYAPRCPSATGDCLKAAPALVPTQPPAPEAGAGRRSHLAACWHPLDEQPGPAARRNDQRAEDAQ